MVRTARRLLHSLSNVARRGGKARRLLGAAAPSVHQAGGKALYTELLTSRKLNSNLASVNEQAEKQMILLTKQMAEREGVTEQLKAQDQMLWVRRMNNIRDRAIEIVNHDLIYA